MFMCFLSLGNRRRLDSTLRWKKICELSFPLQSPGGLPGLCKGKDNSQKKMPSIEMSGFKMLWLKALPNLVVIFLLNNFEATLN